MRDSTATALLIRKKKQAKQIQSKLSKFNRDVVNYKYNYNAEAMPYDIRILEAKLSKYYGFDTWAKVTFSQMKSINALAHEMRVTLELYDDNTKTAAQKEVIANAYKEHEDTFINLLIASKFHGETTITDNGNGSSYELFELSGSTYSAQLSGSTFSDLRYCLDLNEQGTLIGGTLSGSTHITVLGAISTILNNSNIDSQRFVVNDFIIRTINKQCELKTFIDLIAALISQTEEAIINTKKVIKRAKDKVLFDLEEEYDVIISEISDLEKVMRTNN